MNCNARVIALAMTVMLTACAPMPTPVPLPTLPPVPTSAPLPTLSPAPTVRPSPTLSPTPERFYGWAFEGQVMSGAVDATIVALDDGRYRMYFGSWRKWPIGQHQGDSYIASAVSKDGLAWTIERDTGLAGGWPRVIRLADGTYRMYYGGYPGIAAAVSSDGATWQAVTLGGFPPSQPDREYSGLDVVLLPDNSYRMYYSLRVPSPLFTMTGVERIHSAVSKDGLNWSDEAGVRIDPVEGAEKGPVAAHPRVVKLPDGNWKMFYSTAENRIWSATSRDGIDWRERKPEQLFGADAEVVVFPDGRTRVYTNWLDSRFHLGPERQKMWSHIWRELPYAISAEPDLQVCQGRTATTNVEIKGTLGNKVSLKTEIYERGVFDPGDPLAPVEASIAPTSGTAPFTVKLTVTHKPASGSAAIVLTGDDGATHVRAIIAVKPRPCP